MPDQFEILDPLPRSVGLFPALCAQKTVTVGLRQKVFSWTGNDYAVKDLELDLPMLRIQGAVASMRERKTFTDASGQPLFVLRNKWSNLVHRTFVAVAPDNDEHVLFTVRMKAMTLHFAMTVTYTDAITGKEEQLFMRSSNIWATKAKITMGSEEGPVCATMNLKALGFGPLVGKDTYTMSVAPGGDIAMMAALCVCFQEASMNQ